MIAIPATALQLKDAKASTGSKLDIWPAPDEHVMYIQSLQPAAMAEFAAYLSTQVAENGTPQMGYFMPMPRGASFFDGGRDRDFADSLSIPFPKHGWRRCWVMRTEAGRIVGHVDLRAHREPYCEHRSLLGLGVDHEYRRRGIARRLCEHVVHWARYEAGLAAIDLQVLGGNEAAVALYRSLGFVTVMELADFFRVDGQSLTEITMVLRLASAD